MIANMATFDIEKFKMHRQKVYYQMVNQLSRSMIEEMKMGNEHYEHILNIMSKPS